ncbi:MAG: 4Fe-4S binding protein [Candidatus Aminicenantes bacterium]|nr:4Fe-4S binding protein [Candidatus Aminicenantes bacterium]
MKRKIIRIDHDTCNGCGLCLPNCPEGALQLIDGKARLVSDLFCDGLGACIGTCPLGAIHVEEREAEAYDESRVMANIVPQGENVIRAHLAHLAAHNELQLLDEARRYLSDHGIAQPAEPEPAGCLAKNVPAAIKEAGGCPGSRTMDRRAHEEQSPVGEKSVAPQPSELRTWPLQLHLLNPQASFFDNADLLIAADCVPFSYASFHGDFIKGKVPIVFCPKLDHSNEQYLAKLTAIFQGHAVRSLHIVHMEVPCCSGTVVLARQALAASGKNIPVHEYTISLQGRLLENK